MQRFFIDPTEDVGWGLLVRHAERYPLRPGAKDFEASLTEQGRVDARAFGKQYNELSWHGVWSSPVGRCMDTGRHCLEGMEGVSEKAKTQVRSDPALVMSFVADPAVVQQTFLSTESAEDLVRDYVRHQAVPGLLPVALGVKNLLSFVLPRIRPKQLSLFVTHDVLIVPFQSHLLKKSFSNGEWVGYLEGCLIKVGHDRIFVDDSEIHLQG